MRKLLVQHSNKLLRSSVVVAERNDITVVPYPSTYFRNNKDLKQYLTNLTNFIKQPELFNFQQHKINTTSIKYLNPIPTKYFKFIN